MTAKKANNPLQAIWGEAYSNARTYWTLLPQDFLLLLGKDLHPGEEVLSPKESLAFLILKTFGKDPHPGGKLLAKVLVTTERGASDLVDALEAKGYLKKNEPPKKGRGQCIHYDLSPGEAKLQAARARLEGKLPATSTEIATPPPVAKVPTVEERLAYLRSEAKAAFAAGDEERELAAREEIEQIETSRGTLH